MPAAPVSCQPQTHPRPLTTGWTVHAEALLLIPARTAVISVFATGFAVGFGLIVAIGAQNAFVLRQGLRGEHVLAVCLACAVSDALLIAAGVAGFGHLSRAAPWVEPSMRYAGAAFLFWYGFRSFRAALSGSGALVPSAGIAAPLGAALTTCLALTWLNPHVYLDTVLLVGSISTQFPGREWLFGAGAASASFAFFFALGYGATLLRPLFAQPSSWRVLEGMIGATMWIIALALLREG